MPLTRTTQQQLIDCLQVITARAEQIVITGTQQQEDARALLAAAKRAVTLVQPEKEDDR